jgi:hypothetical protein
MSARMSYSLQVSLMCLEVDKGPNRILYKGFSTSISKANVDVRRHVKHEK